VKKGELKKIAIENGILDNSKRPEVTSVFIIDHEKIRQSYKLFTESLPRVQAYYAVKANSEERIVKTLFEMGASFDVASLDEFDLVRRIIAHLSPEEQNDFIWDKIIYAHPIKSEATLMGLNQYKPLVVFDTEDEVEKIRDFAPSSGLILRIDVPNTGSQVNLSSKFGADPGKAVNLIEKAIEKGLNVEGLSFHVGSQCGNFENYVEALKRSHDIFEEAKSRGIKIGACKKGETRKQLDIGGGFPIRYNRSSGKFEELAGILNSELDRLFSQGEYDILAEPGRFLVANACTLVSKVIGKAERDGKPVYYIGNGVYFEYSGQVYDHCRYPVRALDEGEEGDKGELEICTVFGPTCDGFDKVSETARLPRNLQRGDIVFSEKMGAYTTGSSSNFNSLRGTKIVNINL